MKLQNLETTVAPAGVAAPTHMSIIVTVVALIAQM